MYKMLYIKGFEKNQKRRVYTITKEEKENMIDTFVIRETVDGQKVYRSCETDKHYIVAHNKEIEMEDCNKCKWFINKECNTPNNCCDFEEVGADIKNFAEFLKRRLDGRCNGLMIQGFIDDAVRDYLRQ